MAHRWASDRMCLRLCCVGICNVQCNRFALDVFCFGDALFHFFFALLLPAEVAQAGG